MFIINVKSKTFPTSFTPAVKGEIVHVSKRKDLTQVPADVALELHNLNAEEAEKLPDGTAGGKVYDELWALLTANKEALDLADPSKAEAKPKAAAKKTASKAAAKRESGKARAKKASGGGKRGRVSSLAGKHITKLVKENPRRKGTHGFKSFEKIRSGMTYEAYIEAGGRPNDLAWDVEHKYLKVS